MDIKELIQIEIPALSKTICEYSTDNYITSYAKQLMEIEYPREQDRLGLLVERLLKWYATEIGNIDKDQYIYNKDAHRKSYELLLDIKKQIQS